MISTLPKTNINFSIKFDFLSANALNLEQSKNLSSGKELAWWQNFRLVQIQKGCSWLIFNSFTHYQTTNFRLFQTERVCRWQFQIWRKWQKVIQMGRKHSVFKRLVSQGCQKVSLCGNGLTNNKVLDYSKFKPHADNRQMWLKIEICFQTGKKHFVKRRLFFSFSRRRFQRSPSWWVIKSRDRVVKS